MQQREIPSYIVTILEEQYYERKLKSHAYSLNYCLTQNPQKILATVKQRHYVNRFHPRSNFPLFTSKYKSERATN